MGLESISSEDMMAVKERDMPPAGFEQESLGGDDFEFDSLDDLSTGGDVDLGSSFGGSGSGDSWSQSSVFSNDNQSGMSGGMQNGFGNSAFGGNAFGNQNNQPAVPKKDALDGLIDASVDASKSLIVMFKELAQSLTTRNVDDYAFYGRNMIVVGGIMIPVTIMTGIIGFATKLDFLAFGGLSGKLLMSGIFTLSTGLMVMGTSALILSRMGEQKLQSLSEVPEVNTPDNHTTELEENAGSISDDEFDFDFDAILNDLDSEDAGEDKEESNDDGIDDLMSSISLDDEDSTVTFNPDSMLDNVMDNAVLTRETLFNTFVPMLMLNTPGFADTKSIEKGDELFDKIETLCIKAISNVVRKELGEIESNLISVNETLFSYEIYFERVKNLKNTEELAREIEIYFRKDSSDTAVNATVNIEGDNYKIIVTKGTTAVVTFGDIFKLDYCREYYLNKKNVLPVVLGINELGKVLLGDAKTYDSMLIAGKPRSGKSWYVLSMLISMMMFNPPSDVQFMIIDPKESTLFKTLALMPHVLGLHDDNNILSLLEEIINVEAPRRKDILTDNRVDDIWQLRKKGVMLPVLYVVMDEYITIKNKLGTESKQLDSYVMTMLTQFPSIGVRLLVVPHRAMSVISKTNRGNIQFAAIVRGNVEDATDTLGVKWTRQLTNPGDTAVKTASMPNAAYVRGPALTPDDENNVLFIRTVAKAFYKMGVDIPDMTSLEMGCNRDNDYITHELSEDGIRMQFNAQNVAKELSEVGKLSDWGIV